MDSVWTSPVSGAADPLPEACDDVVVGAGIAGLVTALELARAGRDVCVLESRFVGGGTTGRTTGKVSLLQGTRLSTLDSRHSREVAAQYLAFNQTGAEWLHRFCAAEGVLLEERPAATWAPTPESTEQVRKEWEVARALGLPVEWTTDELAPVPSWGAVVLPGQAQLDPGSLLTALVSALRRSGGRLVEGTRVRGAVATPPHGASVRLADGRTVQARNVVVTTGAPVVDRGFYFSRLQAQRSYLLALRVPDPPQVMMLSGGQPSRSLRDAHDDQGRPVLLVGGAGHVTGRAASEAAQVDSLRAWAQEHFGTAEEVAAWSAQDQESVTGLPVVGRMPGSRSPVLVATGFAKWGLTNGPAAALSLVEDVLDAESRPHHHVDVSGDWHDLSLLATTRSWFTHNASTGVQVAQDAVHVALDAARRHVPGLGRVPGLGGHEDGQHCGPCPHMGGLLKWNDLEQTWDCPLHGSRFAPDGEVLDGPAARPASVPDSGE